MALPVATLPSAPFPGISSYTTRWDTTFIHIAEAAVGGFVSALAAKLTLQIWKRIFIGFAATAGVAVVASLLVYGGISIVDSLSNYLEKRSIQDKINIFTKGHYPEDFDAGYRVVVAEVGKRALLVFSYPEGEGYPTPHPLDNIFFESEMQDLLNDNGYPGAPIWGRAMKPFKRADIQKMINNNP